MDEATLKRLRQITRNMSILYVEDDEAIRSQMVKYLGKFFGDIVTAEDGQKGVEWYELRTFDIVMTDILMPNLDGLEMIAQMRERNPEQIIMVTSSYSDSENLMRCIELNVDRFVPKPIDFSRLITLLLQTAVTIHNKRRSETLERTAKRDSNEHAEILDKINHGVMIFKGGCAERLNKTMSDILGCTDTQIVRDLSIGSMFVDPEIGERDNRGVIDYFKEHPDVKIAIRPEDAEHEARYYIVRYERLESSGKEMLTFFDINAMETELKSLHYVLDVDESTGLGSRRALMKTLERLKDSKEGTLAITCVAVCNLDLFRQKFGFRSFGRVFKLLGGAI
jgi:CheY-like chemotaxis protein